LNYKIVFANPSFSSEQMNACIDQCSDLTELQALLDQNLFSIERLDPPFGTLRIEHIRKALNIADYFGTVDVLPDISLLHMLYSKLYPNRKGKVKIDNAAISRYFQDKFNDLELSDDDWQRVIDKLSIEEFISIDTIAERAVIIWNSLPSIKTTNSCTGHRDSPRYFCFSNLFMKYDPEKISFPHLSDLSQSAFADLNSDIFKTEMLIYKNKIDITFFQIPSS